MLGKSAQEEQFQPCWCVHYDLFWANSPVPTSTLVTAWELKSFKMFKFEKGGGKQTQQLKFGCGHRTIN